MNKTKKPLIAESLYDIRQRYEDTAYVLFREHQKRSSSAYLSYGSGAQSYVYSCYGNAAVVVQKQGNNVTKADEKPIESRVCSVM